ncbi:hypothetical protein KCH_29880 [Kitasatospora cheerisanensis KCTC 2395]|uniref:Uncharacterized protein n=1 Tax=Kitasatospora cheerisanensis KCTC 2395 TaxID=1348663 RepID=A0A066YVY1_9ACTN|nr:hypothetical protein KCH_29880 [Kitasatospora cheerisanensis KCTC 2395]
MHRGHCVAPSAVDLRWASSRHYPTCRFAPPVAVAPGSPPGPAVGHGEVWPSGSGPGPGRPLVRAAGPRPADGPPPRTESGGGRNPGDDVRRTPHSRPRTTGCASRSAATDHRPQVTEQGRDRRTGGPADRRTGVRRTACGRP